MPWLRFSYVLRVQYVCKAMVGEQAVTQPPRITRPPFVQFFKLCLRQLRNTRRIHASDSYCKNAIYQSKKRPIIKVNCRPYEKSLGKYWIQYFFRKFPILYREKSIRFNTYQYFFFHTGDYPIEFYFEISSLG